MIVNPEYLFEEQKYKCNKHVMKYLVFECSIPLLSVDEDYFYFTNNDLLKECLERMPLYLRIISKL